MSIILCGFFLVAMGTHVLVVLHVSWSVIWFSGWDTLRVVGYTKRASLFSWLKLGVVVVSHMLLSLLVIVLSKNKQKESK